MARTVIIYAPVERLGDAERLASALRSEGATTALVRDVAGLDATTVEPADLVRVLGDCADAVAALYPKTFISAKVQPAPKRRTPARAKRSVGTGDGKDRK